MAINKITKQISIYLIGIFLLALGVTFSVKANLGVSPVASLGYSLALMSNMSIGAAIFLSNLFFIVIQIIVTKRFEVKSYFIQLMIALVLGVFLDFTMIFSQGIPEATTLFIQIIYLVASIVIIALAASLYLLAELPLTPYDTLVPTISGHYNINLSKTRIICDMFSVTASLLLCMVFLKSWGSIGIGTIISAYFIGKVLGVFMKRFKESLAAWIHHCDLEVKEEMKA